MTYQLDTAQHPETLRRVDVIAAEIAELDTALKALEAELAL